MGLTESAIRNYERGIRTPGDQQIGRIAEALDVSADSIREIGMSGVRGALEVLFRYEWELGLMPVVTGDGVAVAPYPKEEGSQKAAQALWIGYTKLDSFVRAGRVRRSPWRTRSTPGISPTSSSGR